MPLCIVPSQTLGLFCRDLSRDWPHEVVRLSVAYLPEGRGVFPSLAVLEDVAMNQRRGRRGGSWQASSRPVTSAQAAPSLSNPSNPR